MRSLEVVAVSALARVEVPAAIWRKQRLGELDSSSAAVLAEEFEADLFGTESEGPRFATLALGPRLLDGAAALIASSGLRAYDSVQLASAIAARAADPSCAQFACFDLALRDAAATHGFRAFPDRA